MNRDFTFATFDGILDALREDYGAYNSIQIMDAVKAHDKDIYDEACKISFKESDEDEQKLRESIARDLSSLAEEFYEVQTALESARLNKKLRKAISDMAASLSSACNNWDAPNPFE